MTSEEFAEKLLSEKRLPWCPALLSESAGKAMCVLLLLRWLKLRSVEKKGPFVKKYKKA